MAAFWPRERERGPSLSDPRKMSAKQFEAEQPRRGRSAPHVGRIPPAGWRDIAWRVLLEIGKDRLPIVAGGVTFYTLLAIFPALGAFVALYGLFADVETVREQISRLSLILPPGVLELVGEQMMQLATANDGALSATFIGGLLFAIWSAKAGVNALFDGMNIAYGEAEKRPWWKRNLLTLASTAGLIAAITLLSVILIALPVWLQRYGLAPSELWWVPFRWAVAFGVVIVGFAALYRYGPSRALAKWSWVWPGALAAAVGWLITAVAFSIYVGRFANYQDAYGPLGTAIGFMVWIWASAMVLLLGAELNAETEHQTAVDTTTPPDLPMGQRGAAMADSVGARFDGFGFLKRKRQPKKVWRSLRETGPDGR